MPSALERKSMLICPHGGKAFRARLGGAALHGKLQNAYKHTPATVYASRELIEAIPRLGCSFWPSPGRRKKCS